jgi:hypothetical protein
MDNLKFISDLRQSGAIQEFIISFIVNARNFHEMKDFVELGMNLRCDQIYFSFMSDWGTFSTEDYAKMAVHLPQHKDHRELVNLLRDPIFNSPKVFLGNLGCLKPNRILSNDSMFV